MYKKFISCCIASTLSVISTSGLAQQGEVKSTATESQNLAPLLTVASDKGIKNKYIVVLKRPEMMLEGSQALVHFTQQTVVGLTSQYAFSAERIYDHVLSGFSATLTKEQLKSLRSDPQVDFIEQDQIVSLDPILSDEGTQSNAVWGLDRVDQRNLPLSGSYTYNLDGTGVTAYVIDTGVTNTHTEFGGRSRSCYDFLLRN